MLQNAPFHALSARQHCGAELEGAGEPDATQNLAYYAREREYSTEYMRDYGGQYSLLVIIIQAAQGVRLKTLLLVSIYKHRKEMYNHAYREDKYA